MNRGSTSSSQPSLDETTDGRDARHAVCSVCPRRSSRGWLPRVAGASARGSFSARRVGVRRHPPSATPLGEFDVAERLRGREVPGRAGVLRPPPHPLGEAAASADLAPVRFERGDLSIDRPGDVEPDVRVARPEEEHARHAMVLQAAGELLGEEEVIARRDDAVESAPPGDAMVRVHLVVAPGVVREDDVGPVLADDAAYLAAKIHADLELAILVAEEDELLDADRFAGRALLALSRLGHLLGGCLQIVLAFLPAGAHAVGDMAAGRPD